MNRLAVVLTAVLIASAAFPAVAQDDTTTRNGGSALTGGPITGPASTPLSFLNGAAYQTDTAALRTLLPDLAPASLLNQQLPNWIRFGWEERIRDEGYHNAGFKLNNPESRSSTAGNR